MKTNRRGTGLAPKGKDKAGGKDAPTHGDRHRPRILTDREVRHRALARLLPLLAASLPRRKSSPKLLRRTSDRQLRAAARHSSIARARTRSKRGHSERHSRRVPEHLVRRKTQRALTLALREQARPFLPPHPVDVTIDFHDRPYYGQPQDARRYQAVKTKEERGTHRAHRFASVSILLPRFRLIASLRFHPRNGGTLAAVRAALHDFQMVGGKLRAVFLDWGLYTYVALSWLKAQGITAVAPLGLGSRPRKKWQRGKRSYSTIHTLKGPRREDPPLEVTIHAVVRYQIGREWDRHGCQHLIYAVLGDMSLKEVADRYRRRFGIKSNYKILGQTMGRTSSRSPALRLLPVGVGVLLQNEGVILKLLYASEGRQGTGGFRIREELLRVEDLLQMLLRAVGYRLGNVCAVENRRRLPARLRRQGLTLL